MAGMATTVTTIFALRLRIEHKTGNSWTVTQATRVSIVAAAEWRNATRTWCDLNPLPPGYEYQILLPRPIQP